MALKTSQPSPSLSMPVSRSPPRLPGTQPVAHTLSGSTWTRALGHGVRPHSWSRVLSLWITHTHCAWTLTGEISQGCLSVHALDPLGVQSSRSLVLLTHSCLPNTYIGTFSSTKLLSANDLAQQKWSKRIQLCPSCTHLGAYLAPK